MTRVGLVLVAMGLILGLAPRQSEAQTHQDTLALYSAALASRLGEEPAGPDGAVQVVCDITSSEGFVVTTSPTRESLPVDTLPDLTPRLRQVVSDLMLTKYGLPLVDDCENWRDANGRQGVSLGVSAPLFVSDSEAIIYVSASMGGVWGSGGRCTWTREDTTGAWTRQGCTGGWISDRVPERDEAPSSHPLLGDSDRSTSRARAHSV